MNHLCHLGAGYHPSFEVSKVPFGTESTFIHPNAITTNFTSLIKFHFAAKL